MKTSINISTIILIALSQCDTILHQMIQRKITTAGDIQHALQAPKKAVSEQIFECDNQRQEAKTKPQLASQLEKKTRCVDRAVR